MARRLLIKLAIGHAKGQSFLNKFSLFAKAETTPKVAAFVFLGSRQIFESRRRSLSARQADLVL
jgi:hypothetical protein